MNLIFRHMVAAFAVCALAASCSDAGFEYSWSKYRMDGHRTGVRAVEGPDVDAAMGTVRNGVYTSPCGTRFTGGATPRVAAALLAVQDSLAPLKRIVGHSSVTMSSYPPESPLSDWVADRIMEIVASETGRKVDAGIINFGGIRADIPGGAILLDDIVAMFPFRNYLLYVELRGSDLRRLLSQMARERVQAVGGIRFTIRDGVAEEITVGGMPLDDCGTYGIATIDFLLDGGDGLSVGENALDIITTDVMVCDGILAVLADCEAAGKEISQEIDGRVAVL